MENQASDDDEQIETSFLHSSVNVFRKTNKISIGEENKSLKKRSSSMLLNSKNFVPRLKPIKTVICPSPINLNQKSPRPIPENLNTISTSSFDSQNELNLKPIRYIYSRRKNYQKKSFKFLNIEEETYAISDCEDNSKNLGMIHSDSSSSKSEEENETKTKFNKNKNIYKSKNINLMRKKMEQIKKSFVSDNLNDDSTIAHHAIKKTLGDYKNIGKQNFISKIRENKNFNLNLEKIKYRTKSFNIKQRYVSTILGFLEKNGSTNSLNSNGK